MKKIFLIVLFLMLATPLFAKDIYVATGYGYMKDASGNVIAKAELPIGKHNLSNEYTYVEVGNKQILDSVQVYVAPPAPVDPNITKKRKEDLLKVLDITEADITKLKTLEVAPK